MMTDPINVPVAGRLDGQTAIIVGAGQTPGETMGNGKAIALLFARAGASVLCVDRKEDRAQSTADEIVAAGGSAHAFEADITQRQSGDAILAAAQASLGPRIDILVNNVGAGGAGDGPAHKVSEDAMDRVIDINFKGMWRTCKAVIPVMREQRSGAIVNISSLASVAGGGMLAYEATKAAVNRLTTSVAQSSASKGVRCNAITPGLMDTPMAMEGIAARRGISVAELRQERDARVPMGRMGSAWDTAHAALFLVSEEARFITGVILAVDGGANVRIG